MSLDAAIAAADFATIRARPMLEKPIGRCIVDGAAKSAASTAGGGLTEIETGAHWRVAPTESAALRMPLEV